MTDEELKAIEARANEATEGPWDFDKDQSDWVRTRFVKTFPPGQGAPIESFGVCAPLWFNTPDECRRNGTFIAHARTDVPALVAEVRRQRQLLGEIYCVAKREHWDEAEPEDSAYRTVWKAAIAGLTD